MTRETIPASKSRVRDAATVIVLRRASSGSPRVLIGRRDASAAFMASKFVFPGGALDPVDAAITLAGKPSENCLGRLGRAADPALAEPLLAAALRELWEETGLVIGRPDPSAAALAPTRPAAWQGFFRTGVLPSAEGFHFVFRAITPPGRARRFDARFFLVDAARIVNDPDDFSGACDELSALQWAPLDEIRAFNLPFITEVVLAEVAANFERIADDDETREVPFFDNSGPVPTFCHL